MGIFLTCEHTLHALHKLPELLSWYQTSALSSWTVYFVVLQDYKHNEAYEGSQMKAKYISLSLFFSLGTASKSTLSPQKWGDCKVSAIAGAVPVFTKRLPHYQ